MVQDQVEEVKNKTDIVSIIGERVDLKKAGRNFKAPCPFHSEKSPSFIVSPEMQIYKCFGCGEGGDVFSFLKEYEGMDFGEALRYLAQRAGIKLVYTKSQKSDRIRLIEINELVSKFYHYLLLKHPSGRRALSYILKNREIDMDTIKAFKIGYSPNSSLLFNKYIIGKRKVAEKDLETLGIVYRGRSGLVDRFHGRIIFPLSDHRDNIVGFSGRLLPENDDGKSGKYINSPETPLYHKSDMLFGLNLARSEIKRSKEIILVEGELDMISLWQRGIKNTVATKGTAITQSQALLMKRFAEVVILALDTDFAGNAAARRGIEIAEKAGLEVKVARMTKYKDPDEAIRQDPDGFIKVLRNPQSIWDFLIDSTFEKFKGETGTQKQKISKEITPILSSITDSIVRAHYVFLVSNRLGVPVEAVEKQLRIPESKLAVSESEKHVGSRLRRDLLEERLFALAFTSDPDLFKSEETTNLIKSPFMKRVIDIFKSEEREEFNLSEFAKSLPPELFSKFSEVILSDDNQSDSQNKKEFDLVQKELEILDLRGELTRVVDNIRKLEKSGEKVELAQNEQLFQQLSNKLVKLTKDV